MTDLEKPKTLSLPSMARELGITRDEANELKRQIQYVEISGPQRFERGGKIKVKKP